MAIRPRDFDHRAPWIDHASYAEEITRPLAEGSLGPSDAELLSRWHDDGVVILLAAIDNSLIDRLWRDVDRAWCERPSVRINVLGLGARDIGEIGERSAFPSTTYRIVNFQDVSNASVDIILHPRLVGFLLSKTTSSDLKPERLSVARNPTSTVDAGWS